MPTRNRGQHPNDSKLFGGRWPAVLSEAADDFCFLLGRQYAEASTLQLVGNRYRLNKRQRHALQRACCSPQQTQSRTAKACQANQLRNKTVEIDGFNLLILLESALSGAYLFASRDGCYRDISSVHGSYKRVIQTQEALVLIGKHLQQLEVAFAKWYLDQPVSNSGRLKTLLREVAAAHQFNWSVELVYNPDQQLAKSENIVISTDGWILDECRRWFNLGRHIIEQDIPDAVVVSI
ncbi:MAG: DUF434 domain-containing protein [Bacteroidota bacterium]